MTIRSGRADDLEALAAVAMQPLLARYGSTAEGLRRQLAGALERGEGLLVAEAGDRPIGFAWYQLEAGLGLGGYLKLIAVVPGEESHGAGAALLEAVEREVARSRKRLFLLVSDFNEGAQRFYERHGYVRCGRLERAVLAGVDELLYWKRL